MRHVNYTLQSATIALAEAPRREPTLKLKLNETIEVDA